PSHLSMMERGQRGYNVHTLERLAAALRVDKARLLMSDPADGSDIWSIWHRAKPDQKRRIVAAAKANVKKAERAERPARIALEPGPRARCLFFESASRSSLLAAHDLFRKPVSTFRDHALVQATRHSRFASSLHVDLVEAEAQLLRRIERALVRAGHGVDPV